MIVIAIVIGLGVGLVLDLFFDRSYTGQSVSEPLYRCFACKAGLRPVYLVPVLGVLATRGRCFDCDATLPPRAIVLPLGSAALFAASALVFAELGAALLAGFFASILLFLTLTDLEQRLIPNKVVYPTMLLALALSWGWPDASVLGILTGTIFAVAIAGALLTFSLPFGDNAFGMGDVKLIVLMGMIVGLPSVIVGVFVGTIAGGTAAGLLWLFRVVRGGQYIAHGPGLALGGLVALFWGQDIWDWYLDR
jgi:leader peptidase (prepilin peptidase)/N-methyltransferase